MRIVGADDLAPAVETTLAELSLQPEDAAAAALARRYAAEIDNSPDRAAAMGKLGPLLLAVLESLGASPAARSKLKGGATGATGQLQAIRQARA